MCQKNFPGQYKNTENFENEGKKNFLQQINFFTIIILTLAPFYSALKCTIICS
jgi:hypothetical protein